MHWYFRVGDKVQGPISANRMRRFALQKKLRPDHMVSSDKHHWFRADQVFDFVPPRQPAASQSAEQTVDVRPSRRGRDAFIALGVVIVVLVAFAAWRLLS